MNKHTLSEKLLNDLFTQLSSAVGALNQQQAYIFLSSLLGPEEQIMLAKRLAIVVMLQEGLSMYKISRTLKVSPTTVEKVQSAIRDGVYDELVPLLLKNKKNYNAVIELLESVLSIGGVMPRYGQARLPKN